MSLIRKIDVKKHFAAKRRMRLDAAQQTSLPDATGFSGIETTGATPAVRSYVEDPRAEHSTLSAATGAVHVAGESEGNAAFTVPESRQE